MRHENPTAAGKARWSHIRDRFDGDVVQPQAKLLRGTGRAGEPRGPEHPPHTQNHPELCPHKARRTTRAGTPAAKTRLAPTRARFQQRTSTHTYMFERTSPTTGRIEPQRGKRGVQNVGDPCRKALAPPPDHGPQAGSLVSASSVQYENSPVNHSTSTTQAVKLCLRRERIRNEHCCYSNRPNKS